MKDFNIAKYLKENHLGSHAILGRYVDLHGLKEEEDYGNNKPVDEVPYVGADEKLDGFGDEFDQVEPVSEIEDAEENAWALEVDGTEAYKIGNWTCDSDYPGDALVWSYKDVPYNKLAVYATPNFDGTGTTPIQIDVNGETVDNMTLNQSEFVDFNEYAEAMKPYLDRIESLESNWGSLAELENEEVTVSSSGVEMEEAVDDTRIMDLGGDQIEQGIISLLDDGFEPRDIIDLVSELIIDHSRARLQGKKFEEGELNEYEVIYVVRDGKCYRKDDEGNMDQVSMSKCR